MPTEQHQTTDTKFRILFAIYPGMTHLDFTGPHQFLSRLPGSETIVASPAGGDVDADGLTFGNTVRIADVRSCDLICVPGGINATTVALDEAFVGEIRRLATGAKYITSVCTGSLILGAAGLLRGKRAGCHWAWAHMLELFGATHDPARVVRDGNTFHGFASHIGTVDTITTVTGTATHSTPARGNTSATRGDTTAIRATADSTPTITASPTTATWTTSRAIAPRRSSASSRDAAAWPTSIVVPINTLTRALKVNTISTTDAPRRPSMVVWSSVSTVASAA